MVGYNRRFSPMAVRLADHFAGRRGPLVLSYRIAVAPLPPGHWVREPEQGGGRLLGEVCHFVDLVCFLCDSTPASVFATAPSGSADEDVLVTLAMRDGSVASIQYETVGDTALPKERLEVHGGRRSAVLEDWRSVEFWREGRRRRTTNLSQQKGHAEEVAAFLRAIRDGLPSPVSPGSIQAVSLATFAARDSLAFGAPVRLSEEWAS